MEHVSYGEDLLFRTPLLTAAATTWTTGAVLAAGDAKLSTNSQPMTNLLARTIPFTSGSELPVNSAVIVGATSGDRARFMFAVLSSGSWAGGDAAGEMFFGALDSAAIPDFQSENLNIEGGTSNFATIGAALLAAGIFAEIGTSKEYVVAITGAELQTDKSLLGLIDPGADWENSGEKFHTNGHPLAADPRGVRWAGCIGQNNLLTYAGVATNAQTIVIGGKTYTTQTTLTDVDGNVRIGAGAAEDAVNLVSAILIGDAVAFTSMSELPSVGDVLSGDTSTFVATVKAVYITSGTIAGGDAAGWLIVSPPSGAWVSETLTNDTTTTANVTTIGGDATGSGVRYAASMTAHTLVLAAPTSGDKVLIYTKDDIIPQRIPTTETQTNASWAFTSMQANIAADGTTVDLPDANNWDSPGLDADGPDHFIEIVDQDANAVAGYVESVDVAGGTFYGGATAEAGGFDIGAVRLTLKAGSLFRLDLTGSWKLKYAMLPEREMPARVQSKPSTLALSAQEKTDVTTLMQADVVGFKKNQLVEDLSWPMRDADGDLVTGETVTAELQKDGGSFVALDGTVAEIGTSGVYQITTSPALTAAEMNCDQGVLKFTSAGAKPTIIQFYTET